LHKFSGPIGLKCFWGQNGRRGGAILIPNEFIFSFRVLIRLCQFWLKSIKKCDRESARRRTHRLTDTQTQTDFIICPMLYAIAMGQITTQKMAYKINASDIFTQYTRLLIVVV